MTFTALFGATLFLAAGRFDLPWFWAYVLTLPAIGLTLGRFIDRDLVRERMRPGPGGVDRALRWFASPFLLVHLVLAGLDARYSWSSVPPAARAAAYVGFAAAFLLATWAMVVNRFFSPVVRVQTERGHEVVSSGPYRWIRHPGYAATVLGFPWGGLVLGSWWALLPMLPVVVLILRRTLIEDRYLHANLPGYRAYAARVRWRILPGLW